MGRGVRRPLLLDLFCGAGGAAMGYHRAGFDVIGIDIDPQPDYPFEFVQGDALSSWAWAKADWSRVDAIHASPPCQRYSDLAHRNGNADAWPDLVDPTRQLLQVANRPYVIENVEGAPLIDPVTLCGTMFAETSVIRHRLFETNWPLVAPSVHPKHPLVFTHDKRKAHYGRLDQDVSYVQVTGGGNATLANKRRAMAMPWANNHGLNEAIPPAYTLWIGAQLGEHIRKQAAA
jgi:DNA (cytosine-5)-methyltransferase 1